jgi:hypothetical protein
VQIDLFDLSLQIHEGAGEDVSSGSLSYLYHKTEDGYKY